MTRRDALPPEIEALVRSVLEVADIDALEGALEVERELRAHFEDGLDGGVRPEDLVARFGDPETAGRRIAESRGRSGGSSGSAGRWWTAPGELWIEARRAARRLMRAPGFTAVVVATLALGVGVNTAIFTVLDAVLVEDLPYADPGRLVRVYDSSEDTHEHEFIPTLPFVEWRRWDEVFEGLASIYTYREMGADLTSGSAPRRINVAYVSAGYFETLGVGPALGRSFREEESFGPGEADSGLNAFPVVVLSHALWTDELGADPAAVGRAIELDGTSYEIVGVMPPGFTNPFGPSTAAWLPHDLRPGGWNSFGNHFLSAVGRLRAGLTVGAAQDRLRTLARGHTQAVPEVGDSYPAVVPLQSDVVGATRARMLFLLAAAAGLVLLTACLNVANLLFARGFDRDRDRALRSALGSGRSRLMASILAENGLLALAGGGAGLTLGWIGVTGLLAVAPDTLPGVADVTMDGSVFGFALGVTVAALLLFGLAPALRLSGTTPAEVLRSGDRTSTARRATRGLRDALVVAQVAAAVVLVAGAALLARSFHALLDVPLGVEPAGVLTFEVHLPIARYPEPADRDAFHTRLHERIAALPGVEAAGATSWLPAMGRYHSWGLYFDPEQPDGSNDEAWYSIDVRTIAGDYLEAMDIGLLRGVSPSEVDLEGEPMVWLNRTAAETFGETDVLGKLVLVSGQRRVVGIVEDVAYSPRGDVSRKAYIPHVQADDRNWALIQTVRARGDLGSVAEAIRDELHAQDGQLVMYRARPFESLLSRARAQDRFATSLMGAFAVLALVLSLVGTYGVLAGSVVRRTREFGIRMALGADRGRVRAIVLRHAATLIVPGVALGLTGAWAGGRWLEALLFQVDALDPAAFGVAALLFAMSGAVAAWLPAARATRVDTVEALTAE